MRRQVLICAVCLLSQALASPRLKPDASVASLPDRSGRALKAIAFGEYFNPSLWDEVFIEDFTGNGGVRWGEWEAQTGDGSQWDTGKGWGNAEEETYTEKDNVDVVLHKADKVNGDPLAPNGDGFLKITARKVGNNITSARLRTRLDKNAWSPLDSGTTLRVSVRVKLPQGQGLWGSAWMLPADGAKSFCSGCGVYGTWPASGEIDILESINDMSTVEGNQHYGGQYPIDVHTAGTVHDTLSSTFAGVWHTFAVEWSPDGSMVWKVDDVGSVLGGRIYYSSQSGNGTPLGWYTRTADGKIVPGDAPFDKKFYLILNLAVGGKHTATDRATCLKTLATDQSMLVDWVRVYKMKASGKGKALGVPSSLPLPQVATTFSAKDWKLLWADEFSTKAGLRSTEWEAQVGDGSQYDVGKGWGNGEQQVYTAKDNAKVVAHKADKANGDPSAPPGDGFLQITARKVGNKITSGRVRTRLGKNAWAPSSAYPTLRIMARIKLPAGQGLRGAFTLLPAEQTTPTCIGCGPYGSWPASGQVDITSAANDMTSMQANIFYGGLMPLDASRWSTVHDASGGSFAGTWHTVSLEWNASGRMVWLIDDRIFYSVKSGKGTAEGWYSLNKAGNLVPGNAPFDRKFYVLLNLAVGGTPTGVGRAGCLRTLAQEKSMLVDWVRVYGKPSNKA